MTGFGLILSILFVPEIPSADTKLSTPPDKPYSRTTKTLHIISAFNPTRIFRLWVYPNIFLAVCLP